MTAARTASDPRDACGETIAATLQITIQAASASSQRSARTAAIQRSTAPGSGRRGLRMTRSLSQSGARRRF